MGVGRALRELGVSFGPADVLVLCYHAVRSRARFADHMAALLAGGFAVISMPEFRGWLRSGTPAPARTLVLTFDGLYRSQIQHAAPVLESLKIPATFFPIADDLADAAVLADLRALRRAGHTIGCHSQTHADLTMLPDDALDREVAGARRVMEAALGETIDVFCYPDGACDDRVARVVRQAGFDIAFTVDLGGVRRRDDAFRLKRVPILGEPSGDAVASHLSGRRVVSGGRLIWWKLRERVWERRVPGV